MSQVFRPQRVGENLRFVLGKLLLNDDFRFLQDDRPIYISINRVEVSADLRFAKVAVGPVEDNVISVCVSLNKFEPQLRFQIAKQLPMRRVPRLQFFPDWTDHRLFAEPTLA